MISPDFFFYSQPLSHRFGTVLRESLVDARWQTFEAAGAWVRRSGTKHIDTAIKTFLDRGGKASFCIGLDFRNTSIEGLESLLGLQRFGYLNVYVYHNEANVVYHPKVYLLSSKEEARLIVGSNNLTEAGLFRNTEAGLQLDADKNSSVIRQAMEAFMAWQDTSSDFVRSLDAALLDDLVIRKYVFPEKTLQKQEAIHRKKRKKKDWLFGRRYVSAPPRVSEIVIPPRVVGTVLLMRVRRASEKERRTQVQIPIRVVRTGFFGKAAVVRSAHDGRVHDLITARARGTTNTIKLEVPEIDPMDDPVVRFERKPTGIEYQTYDSRSALGRPIMEALERGRVMTPPVTQLTVPTRPQSATWWRFV